MFTVTLTGVMRRLDHKGRDFFWNGFRKYDLGYRHYAL